MGVCPEGESWPRTLEFVVFDDYGTDEGVLKAVQEHIQGGSLEIVGGFGNRPPWKYHGRVTAAPRSVHAVTIYYMLLYYTISYYDMI